MPSIIRKIIDATARRTAWGINLSKVSCPRCRTVQPRLRKPADERQRLWGGWTCRTCGTEMDKWGRKIAE